MRGGRISLIGDSGTWDQNFYYFCLLSILVVGSLLFTWSTRLRITALAMAATTAILCSLEMMRILPFGIGEILSSIQGPERARLVIIELLLMMGWMATRYARDIKYLASNGMTDFRKTA
jgi:hypothetical protein